jgi:hypothetical protein
MSNAGSLVKALLEPAKMTPERATGQIPFDSISRSYFLMRTLVGVLGLALPILLLLGDLALNADEFKLRGSLSAYYHSGARDVFVSILTATGILLVTYKITELNRDNLLSFIAGIAAIGVAFLPTGIPSGVNASLTPLQEKLGEGLTKGLHYGCAGLFILALGLLCYDFARRERNRTQARVGHDARFPPTFWYSFHLTAAVAIVCAVVFIGATQLFNFFDDYSILIGEVVVTVAFGLSWLAKGLDRNVLPKMTKW